jgi:hypothetical protein
MEHMHAFENLASLDVGNSPISDEGLKHLRKSKITHLYLGAKNKATDKGLEYLHEMKTLQYLGFSVLSTNFTPEGLRKLQEDLPDLKISSLKK